MDRRTDVPTDGRTFPPLMLLGRLGGVDLISEERQKPVQKAATWLCSVCGRGVGSNSMQCTKK